MKAQLIGNTNGGFVTLEILIAFTIFILCVSAAVMVNFGNQSKIVNAEINQEALSKAQTLLERARVDSRQDFNSVNPFTQEEQSGPLTFTKKLVVTQKDFFTKEVTANVSWQIGERTLSTILTTILVNRDAKNESDTCSSILDGDWKNPQIESTINFSSLVDIPAGTYTIGDIDAYRQKLYAVASKTSTATHPTFFVFDTSDPTNPTLLGKIDNAPTLSAGLNKITVSDNHAYLANAYASSAQNCVEGSNCAQLQIIDTSNPSTPSVIKNMKILELTSSGNLAAGTDIFYNQDHVYLGLAKTNGGREFNIIDISDPSNPVQKVGYAIGNGINFILVKNNYAYIASPNANELKILDVSNFNHVAEAGRFNAPSGAGHGKNIYLVGEKLYLAKTTGVGFDFHILNNTNPETTLPQLGGRDLGTSVNAVLVRDYLSFLLTGTAGTGSKLQIFKTDDPTNITPWNTSPLSLSENGNATEPSMDCEGNRIYISSNDSSGQGSIYIIKPSTE